MRNVDFNNCFSQLNVAGYFACLFLMLNEINKDILLDIWIVQHCVTYLNVFDLERVALWALQLINYYVKITKHIA